MKGDTDGSPRRKSKKKSSNSHERNLNSSYHIFITIVMGFIVVTSTINVMYHQRLIIDEESARNTPGNAFRKELREGLIREKKSKMKNEKKLHSNVEAKSTPRLKELTNDSRGKDHKAFTNTDPVKAKISPSAAGKPYQHKLGGLSCAQYGGPSDEAASEMVYWSDIPSDSSYVSPLKKKASGSSVQYITFEPDGGGWNNIRMAMETVVVMAYAMGRTLVMPPGQKMYLLGKDRNKQNIHFSFADFFHLNSIHMEHAGIDIITHEEFLLREAMTGNLKNKTSGQVSFPPYNRTNWDGQDPKEYKEWLREVTITPLWSPDKCIASFPASDGSQGIDRLNDILKATRNKKANLPERLPVDSEPVDRMQEMRAGRSELCLYDEEMQNAPILHFMCYHKMRVRLLVHFYAFIFFEDWKQQLWTSRFVRDHLRYIDELQCGAARVVEALREKAKENGNPEGIFDSFHVRRGDFQYKSTRIEATELYKNSADLIPENATLYIATDERKKFFFDPIKQHYHVYFLDDFKHLFEKMNTNYYGMLDQLIASKGRTFVGTYHSTFTGYINRMRGYLSQKQKLEGYEIGAIKSYYFTPGNKKRVMEKYASITRPFYAREFPVSWRDIDNGILD